MALLHIAYERLVTGIHNEDTIEQYRINGLQAGPPAVPGPLVRPAGHHAARTVAALGGPRRDRHRDAGAAPRQRLLASLNTESPNLTYAPERLSMEKVEDAPFSPTRPHWPADHAQPGHLIDTRDKLAIYSKAGLLDVSSANALPQLGNK